MSDQRMGQAVSCEDCDALNDLCARREAEIKRLREELVEEQREAEYLRTRWRLDAAALEEVCNAPLDGAPTLEEARIRAFEAERSKLLEQACKVPGLTAHVDELQYVVGLYQRWILSHAKYVNSCDHACAECVPGGPMVSKTFVCAVHTARARHVVELAAPEAES